MKSEIQKIVKIANKLDELNLHSSADNLTKVALKMAQNFDEEYDKFISRTERENEPKDMPEIMSDDYSSVSPLENDQLMIRYKELAKKDTNWYDEKMTDLVEEKLKDAIQGTDLANELKPGDFYSVIEPWIEDEMTLQQAFEDYDQSSKEADPRYYDEDEDDGDVPDDFGY